MGARRVLLLAAVALSLTAGKLDRLSDAEQIHYEALRVWMDAKQTKAYLRLKTEAERDAWLKANGLWERFYKYDDRQRAAIHDGHVAVGWTQDMVFMAWGPPHERLRTSGQTTAGRSETFVYRFEVTDDGRVLVWAPKSKETHNARELYRVVLVVNEGVVGKLDQITGWE